MKTLAVDLSTRRGTVALAQDGRVIMEEAWANDQRNAAPFFKSLERVLTEFGTPQRIVVGLGPGSYSGTRIALATAVGLAAAVGCELTGFPSVVALSDESDYLVVGDAKRSSYFFSVIKGGKISGPTELLSREELFARLRTTDLPAYTSDKLDSFPGVEERFPTAALLLELVQLHPENLLRAPLSPIYLREPHITKPKS